MKKIFEDGSFIEINLGSPGYIALTLAARDKDNPLKLLVNSKEITVQEFSNMVGKLPIELPIPQKDNS